MFLISTHHLFEETELETSRDGIGIDRLPEGNIDIFSKRHLKGLIKNVNQVK